MNSQYIVKQAAVQKSKKQGFLYFLLSILFVFVVIAMVVKPQQYIAVSLTALLVWSTVVLPAIFPFLLYAKFLTRLGLVDTCAKAISPITKKLFNTSGISAYIYLASMISGYPVGAKLVSDMYADGRMDRGNALRTITYCATSGPMFVLGTVGIGLFLSQKAGYIMLFCHFAGAFLNGLLYRNYKLNDTTQLPTTHKEWTHENFLYETAISSCNSMLIVGTYIVFFFILIEFLKGIFVPNNLPFAVLGGILEITHGCQDLSNLPISLGLKTVIATFIISFGGISTLVQSLAFLKKMKFSTSFFVLAKLTHALLATAICALVVWLSIGF
jgi:sporulation integral membrane protein YlbJ